MSEIIPSKYFMMVTEACNCACNYCYLDPNPQKMDQEILEISIREIMAHCENPLFMWYGGEPMLAGIDFFQEVVNLQEKNGTTRRNLIQTNLTIQDKKLIEFLLDQQFVISTSLDGSKQIHDERRKLKSGKPTFELIMSNVHFIQEKGYTPWAICVVSSSNVGSPKETYDFFNGEGINVRFCPEIGTSEERIHPEEYIQFIKNIYSNWSKQTNKISISNFNKARKTIRIGKAQECDSMQNCLEDYLGINTNGDAYPCNRFVGRKDFILGNIKNGLISILSSEKHHELSQRSTNFNCDCFNYSLLYGGCMFNSYIQTGDWKQLDWFCPANGAILKLFQGD